MQFTGHTSTQDLSLTPIHGSAMTKVMTFLGIRGADPQALGARWARDRCRARSLGARKRERKRTSFLDRARAARYVFALTHTIPVAHGNHATRPVTPAHRPLRARTPARGRPRAPGDRPGGGGADRGAHRLAPPRP